MIQNKFLLIVLQKRREWSKKWYREMLQCQWNPKYKEGDQKDSDNCRPVEYQDKFIKSQKIEQPRFKIQCWANETYKYIAWRSSYCLRNEIFEHNIRVTFKESGNCKNGEEERVKLDSMFNHHLFYLHLCMLGKKITIHSKSFSHQSSCTRRMGSEALHDITLDSYC